MWEETPNFSLYQRKPEQDGCQLAVNSRYLWSVSRWQIIGELIITNKESRKGIASFTLHWLWIETYLERLETGTGMKMRISFENVS